MSAIQSKFKALQQRLTATGGTDSIPWQTATGSAGLSFSMSPLTFAAGGLSSGVFTDTSGTIFTGYSGASTDRACG